MYLIYYFTVIFLCFFIDFIKSSYVKIIILNPLLFLLLVIFVGFRSSNVGTDTINYIFILDNFEYYNFSNLEPIYYYFNFMLLKNFNGPFVYFLNFFLISFFTWLFFLKAINNMKISFSIFFIIIFSQLGFFYDQFNTIRQLLALSICFYAFYFLLDKKFKQYFFWVIIASLIHYSAILCLFLFIPRLLIRNFNKLIVFTFVLLYIIVDLFSEFLVSSELKYAAYIGEDEKNNLIGNGALLFNTLFLFLAIYFIRRVSGVDREKYKFFLYLVICSYFIQFLIYINPSLSGSIFRLTNYFNLGYVFLYSYVFFSFKGYERILYLLLLFSILSMKFIYLFSFASIAEYSILDYFGW